MATKISGLISKIKEGAKFNPEGQVASKLVNYGKKLAVGSGLLAAAILAYFHHLGMAAFQGAIIGATIGGTAGAFGGAIVGAQAGAAIGTIIIPIPIVGTVVGGAVGGAIGASIGLGVGASIGAVAGGLIGLGLASGKISLVSAGSGAAIGATVGTFAGYAAGAAAWGLVVAGCTAVTGGACVFLAVFTPAAGAVGGLIGATIGAAIGGTVGYVVGNYVLDPAKNFLSSSVQNVKGFFQGSEVHGEFSTAGINQGSIGGAIGSGFGQLTGWASSLWNGAVSTAGNVLSFGGSVVNGTLGLLSGSSASASTTSLAQVAVGGAVGTVATATVVAGIVTNATFFNPEGEITEDFPDQGQNEFSITKTANPTSIAAGASVTFTITITPKSQAINSIGFLDNFRFINNGTETSLNGQVPALQCVTPIAVGGTCTIQFTFSTFLIPNNSLLINSIVVSATMADGSKDSGSATATVNIGAPQNAVCNFSPTNGTASWTQAELNNIDAVCVELSHAPQVISLLNNAGTIPIIKNTGACFGSVNGQNIVTIGGCDFSSLNLAKYVLIHELGHVLNNYNGSILQNYKNAGVYETEGLVETYYYSPIEIEQKHLNPHDESLAEAFADYVVSNYYNYLARGWSGYPGGPWNNPGAGFTTFQNDNSQHYDFVKNNIFGGIEY